MTALLFLFIVTELSDFESQKEIPMYKGIDHIAIAVHDIKAAAEFYRRVFQLDNIMDLSYPADGVHTNLVLSLGPNHELELIGPLGEDGFLVKFLRNQGQGVHHLALEVDDIDGETRLLAGKGIRIFGTTREKGMQFTFLHPKSTLNTGMQLMQRNPRKPSRNPLIKGIHHIAIRVAAPQEGRTFFGALGAQPLGRATDPHLECACETFALGTARFQILYDFAGPSPALKPDGLHHVALAVDDLAAAVEHLGPAGIGPLPQWSADACAWLPPGEMHGCLWKLVEAPPR